MRELDFIVEDIEVDEKLFAGDFEAVLVAEKAETGAPPENEVFD